MYDCKFGTVLAQVNSMRYYSIIAYFISAFALPHNSFALDNLQTDSLIYTITYIVDGDTFDGTDSQGNTIRFRPIGLDCPETGKRNGKPEPYHQEATEYTTALLKGKKVRVEYDVQSRDRYGRDLVYVYLMDGTFYNDAIIRAGWAVVATFPPNVKYVDLFIDAQREAREQGRGVWNSTK